MRTTPKGTPVSRLTVLNLGSRTGGESSGQHSNTSHFLKGLPLHYRTKWGEVIKNRRQKVNLCPFKYQLQSVHSNVDRTEKTLAEADIHGALLLGTARSADSEQETRGRPADRPGCRGYWRAGEGWTQGQALTVFLCPRFLTRRCNVHRQTYFAAARRVTLRAE